MPTIKKPKLIVLRGKEFYPKDISLINKIVKKHYHKGRSFISRIICEKLNWKQPNGWLKDRACREVLRDFHKKKLINLPRSKKRKKKGIIKKVKQKNILLDKLFEENVDSLNFFKIIFQQVKGTRDEHLWNKVVAKYHYLGFKTFVGRSLKYLIYYDGKIIAAIGFNDPAWHLISRDELLAKEGLLNIDIRWMGINNGRFLILPWIKIPNLASYILSKSIKIGAIDWETYYNVKPLYIETFVDPTKFLGTCYKADNWKLIGKSKGYKKSGSKYSNSQLPKLIFLKLFSKNIIYYKKSNL